MIESISAEQLWGDISAASGKGEPFVFAVDYSMKSAYFTLHPKENCGIYWEIDRDGNSSTMGANTDTSDVVFESEPISLGRYEQCFDVIQKHLKRGDTFLANLTVPTKINTNCTLEEIYRRSNSRFKFCVPDKFVCFSPEIFVNIDMKGIITSYPMKGTISGSIPNAKEIILSDYKETAEHHTIVDFIRSDISSVAVGVRVGRLRYIDELETSKGQILQVSSEISGILPHDWERSLGDILRKLLPAGSISGAPKLATLEAIREAEIDDRGFYTGVFGYFDGKELKTAVMIRYIEQDDRGEKTFRSGGGITINSECIAEYEEVKNKVYLAF